MKHDIIIMEYKAASVTGNDVWMNATEIAADVSKSLSFVRKKQKFLAMPQAPPLISANNTIENASSLLQWAGNAIDFVGPIYGIDEMSCINSGNTPFKQLDPLLYKIFGVESKDCYRFYTSIKCRKNWTEKCCAMKNWSI